jgi:hypothetical protein
VLLALVIAAGAGAQLLPPIQLNPARIAADSNPTTVSVFGSGFTSGMVVEWNQQPRPTTFVGSAELQVTLSVSDLAFPSLSTLAVWDPTGSTQLTSDAAVLVYLAISNNALAYDPTRDLIYVAVSAQQTPNGKSIGVLNPETAIIESFYALDSEPLRLAVSGDGQYLYVAMSTKIERINLTTWTVELDIPLSLGVLSMAVLSGQPQSIAVSLDSGADPDYGGTVVFDGAQQRSAKIGLFEGPSYLAGGPNPGTIYAYDGSAVFYTLALNSSGVTVASSATLATGFVIPVYAGGFLYLWDAVVDPTIPRVIQTYGIGGTVGPFPALNEVLVLEIGDVLDDFDPGNILALVDVTTGNRIWTQSIPALPSSSNGVTNDPILTWGTNGVAFRDGTGDFSTLDAPAIQLFRVNVGQSASSPFLDFGPLRNRGLGSQIPTRLRVRH